MKNVECAPGYLTVAADRPLTNLELECGTASHAVDE